MQHTKCYDGHIEVDSLWYTDAANVELQGRQVVGSRSWGHTQQSCAGQFCSLAVLDPTVGHTMDVLSPVIPVLCHSD